MTRLPAALVALALTAFAVQAHAETPAPAKKTAAKPAAKKVTPKATSSRQQLKTEAKELAAATDAAEEAITPAQLDIAVKVMTGDAQCEFNQTVHVSAIDARPGHFKVAFKKVDYVMVPEETTTGAVRLLDRKNGIVWLQIPFKSMLMNSKVGQRLVDSCMQTEQRLATNAAAAAGANKPPVLLTGPNQATTPVLVVAPAQGSSPAEVIAVIPAQAASAAALSPAEAASAPAPSALVITPSTAKP